MAKKTKTVQKAGNDHTKLFLLVFVAFIIIVLLASQKPSQKENIMINDIEVETIRDSNGPDGY